MNVPVVGMPCVVHVVPGRLRLRLPGWPESEQRKLEAQLRRHTGVQHLQANLLTGTILIRFDPALTSAAALLAVAQAQILPDGEGSVPSPPALPPCPAQARPLPPISRRADGSPQAICPTCGRQDGHRRLAPGLALFWKAARLLLGLLLADSPLGLLVGGLDVLGLLAEALMGQRTSHRGAAPRNAA